LARLIILDADMLVVTPGTKPLNTAVTASALADVAGLLNATCTRKFVPAAYVPLPSNAVKLVITSAACALILM